MCASLVWWVTAGRCGAAAGLALCLLPGGGSWPRVLRGWSARPLDSSPRPILCEGSVKEARVARWAERRRVAYSGVAQQPDSVLVSKDKLPVKPSRVYFGRCQRVSGSVCGYQGPRLTSRGFGVRSQTSSKAERSLNAP